MAEGARGDPPAQRAGRRMSPVQGRQAAREGGGQTAERDVLLPGPGEDVEQVESPPSIPSRSELSTPPFSPLHSLPPPGI